MNLKSITLLSLCLCLPVVVFADEVTMTFSQDFSRHNLRFSQQHLMGEAYDMIQMDNLDQTVEVGEPCLPVKTMNVYIPRGKAVGAVRVGSISQHTLTGQYMILPVQQEVPIGSGLPAEPILPDESIYALAEQWPSSPVRLETSGSMAGRKIASISIFPVQIVPAARQAIFNDEITVAIDLVDSQERTRLPRETENVRKMRNSIVAAMVANPTDLEQDFSGPAPLDPAVAY
jgi:hypothetical protein